MAAKDSPAIAAIRRFNRFHTRWIGALGGSLHGSGFALVESRVLYELAQRDDWLASELARELALDPAYLSRILKGFAAAGWLRRERSPDDGRASHLLLTREGHDAFRPLDEASRDQAGSILARLGQAEQADLVEALGTAERLLSGACERKWQPLIREHRPGDIGWVISAHGRLYAEDYGWDISFEALVAEITAQFIRSFDHRREHCWIAEIDGEPVGSIFLVKASDEVAKLRLLLVEKKARGLGVGRALTDQCIRFAREKGYRSITLWTQSMLVAARDIYQRAGFVRVAEEKHHSFGVDLVGETWEMKL
jgi:DNA-binding MarR family transcriptional regulator/GNAT superfamily N-acetyltransferase